MTTFFIAVPVGSGGLFALAWLGVGEVARRSRVGDVALYNRAALSSLAGAMAAALLVRIASPGIAPRHLLVIAGAVLPASALSLGLSHRARFVRAGQSTDVAGLGNGTDGVRHRHVAYLPLLLATAAVGAFAGVLVEFLFYASVTKTVDGVQPVVFAHLHLWLNGSALIGLVVVEPRTRQWLGIGGSLLLLPLTLLLLSPALLMGLSLAIATTLRVTEGGLKSSIHRVNWEQAYSVIPELRRGRAKIVIDALAVRVAEAVAAILLFDGVRRAGADYLGLEPLTIVTFILGSSLAAWASLTWRLAQRLQASGCFSPGSAARSAPLPDT